MTKIILGSLVLFLAITAVRNMFIGSDGCNYKGSSYQQGQKWADGCKSLCTCINAKTGNYTCEPYGCPQYSLPPGCIMVAPALGKCCATAYCPNMNFPFHPPQKGTCYIKGKSYKQGEKWEDGCNYQCTCSDATIGHFQCEPYQCPAYSLPPGCIMVAPALGKCCATAYCPNLGFPFRLPQKGTCYIKGKSYKQGEKWEEGCEYRCTCSDASIGHFQCEPYECPQYTLPPGCTMMPPKPGKCCATPNCPSYNNTKLHLG